ncbi:MAG: hypothetical protein LBP20_10440 [Treponema sp.]|jgi:hypothetical protein|nr:hypothetical protein [Treponema sp.]
MVYLAKKNETVDHHTDAAATEVLDGINAPNMEITGEEFEAAGGFARLINGEIFLGKSGAEDNAGQNRFLKSRLTRTDYIAAKISESTATAEEFMYRTWL